MRALRLSKRLPSFTQLSYILHIHVCITGDSQKDSSHLHLLSQIRELAIARAPWDWARHLWGSHRNTYMHIVIHPYISQHSQKSTRYMWFGTSPHKSETSSMRSCARACALRLRKDTAELHYGGSTYISMYIYAGIYISMYTYTDRYSQKLARYI